MKTSFRNLIEIAGILGVISSLLFVGIEIRQNTIATRSATQQAVYESSVQNNINIMSNPRLREVLIRSEQDPNWINNEPRSTDRLLLERFYINRFNNLDNVYYHYLAGTYDPSLWEGIEGWINLIREEPLMIHFWNEYRGTDGPEYREYMDSSLTQSNFD
ncbi:MAG TPA: hypothetical protein QGF41_02910 [Gammaproteobacteria bacterium]|nr:hypothetical protein [Gammaproteobacteria bacterium]